MSDTPNAADDCMKLLDAGHTIILRKSGMGSYLAVCVSKETSAGILVENAVDLALGWDGGPDPRGEREFDDNMPGVTDTDDFTPSQALYRLTEKATTGNIA